MKSWVSKRQTVQSLAFFLCSNTWYKATHSHTLPLTATFLERLVF